MVKVQTGKDDDTKDSPKKPSGLGVRHFQGSLMFGGLVFGYFLRANMSVAVVAMVDPNSNSGVDHFDWDPATKSLLLSSFFWGYVAAQIPSGILAQRFGAKIVLGIANIICSVATILIPLTAKIGDWQFVCAMRILIGLTQGTLYPCTHTLLAKWVPSTERAFLSTFIYSGAQLGTVIMYSVSGILSDSTTGWPSLFYFSGVIALIWSISFLIWGSDSPKHVKHITPDEREYIESLTGSTHQNTSKTPWKAIFTSVPFIALIFAQSGFSWGFYTLLTEMPSYMASVLKMDIKSNTLLSALPYFAMWILCLIISPIADTLNNRGITTRVASRKIFNTIGQWIPMIALIGLAFMSKDTAAIAVLLLTVAVGFNAASYCGYLVNHMDISPNFAGTMMGISNGFANIMSLFAPLVVGAIVKDEEDPYEWRIVFFITAGVYLVSNSVFLLFGSASIQPWNEIVDSNSVKNNSSDIDRQHQITENGKNEEVQYYKEIVFK